MKTTIKRLLSVALCVILMFSAMSVCFAEEHKHTWGEPTITKEATETEIGEITYVCTECGEVRTETIEIITEDICNNPVSPLCRVYSNYINIPLFGPLLMYFHSLIHLFF